VCVCARKEMKGHKMIFSQEGKAESEGTSGVSGEGEGGNGEEEEEGTVWLA